MKKSKLSITLVTSFIAAMALSACSSVSAKKETIVSFTPYGSKQSIALLTDDIYNQYKNTNAGVSKFYEKILEVLIRYEFKDAKFEEGEKKYSEIEKWAENEVEAQKAKAKANAKNNGTSYDTEWDSILESNDVENAKELKEKFIYEKEKEVYKNWYADDVDAKLKSEFLGVKNDGLAVDSDVKAAMPYHIRHILVKADEASNADEKFYRGTITETQAKNLFLVASKLAAGELTFSEIAKLDKISEDGSNANGGDVGIMTNSATSGSLQMVNEFQLGLYAWDSLYNPANAGSAADDAIKAGLGISAEVISKMPANVGVVPYEAFVKLNDYAEITADGYGNELAKGSTALYPRNIIWNKYLNRHNVFLIKNARCGAEKFGQADANEEFNNPITDTQYDANLAGFNADGYLTAGKGNDNLIVGVRSEFGIHFMVIEKSMYDYQTLETYYDTKVPGQDGYDENADSYVNYVSSDADRKQRGEELKTKITSFDSTYDYRLYSYLTEEKYAGRIEFKGDAAEGLDVSIHNYIKFLKEDNVSKQEDGLEKVWRTYYELLEKQEYDRNRMFDTMDTQGNKQEHLTCLVSEKAAEEFYELYKRPDSHTAYYADFNEGGIFYYYA